MRADGSEGWNEKTVSLVLVGLVLVSLVLRYEQSSEQLSFDAHLLIS